MPQNYHQSKDGSFFTPKPGSDSSNTDFGDPRSHRRTDSLLSVTNNPLSALTIQNSMGAKMNSAYPQTSGTDPPFGFSLESPTIPPGPQALFTPQSNNTQQENLHSQSWSPSGTFIPRRSSNTASRLSFNEIYPPSTTTCDESIKAFNFLAENEPGFADNIVRNEHRHHPAVGLANSAITPAAAPQGFHGPQLYINTPSEKQGGADLDFFLREDPFEIEKPEFWFPDTKSVDRSADEPFGIINRDITRDMSRNSGRGGSRSSSGELNRAFSRNLSQDLSRDLSGDTASDAKAEVEKKDLISKTKPKPKPDKRETMSKTKAKVEKRDTISKSKAKVEKKESPKKLSPKIKQQVFTATPNPAPPPSQKSRRSSSISSGIGKYPSTSSFSLENCLNEFHAQEGKILFQDETARVSKQSSNKHIRKKSIPRLSNTFQPLRKSKTSSSLSSRAGKKRGEATMKDMESGLGSFKVKLNAGSPGESSDIVSQQDSRKPD
ncbi:hypothetical protein JCM33374_g5820 [Metschnikowia sp. JCM 33374]|nr:hypothetical protein JCM33374_g5820 [Metschnikowia sp. JCM 33374]